MQDYIIDLGGPMLQILEEVHNYDIRPISVIPQKTKIKNKIVVIERRKIFSYNKNKGNKRKHTSILKWRD
jgi:hypothetical protein